MPSQPPLEQTIATTDALLTQYLEVLGPKNTAQHVILTNPPHALPLLSDCARLLKAQVTKLSLLAINKPFTPSAISSVLRDTSTSCLPAMMSAVQICDNQRTIFGSFFADEVRARVRRVVREMLGLVREVASIADESKSGNATGRDSLSSTGIVWSGCDDIVTLTAAGVADLALRKAEAYRDMIKDAINELQEWREGNDTENEGTGDGLLDSDDEGVDGDNDSLDDMFNAANSLPANRPELEKLVEEAEAKLKKVVILYTALMKRRLKGFPSHPTVKDEETTGRLESAVKSFKAISEMVDDMANSFYDLDEESSAASLDNVLSEAMKCAELMEHNANGEEDAFTSWVIKWKEVILNADAG